MQGTANIHLMVEWRGEQSGSKEAEVQKRSAPAVSTHNQMAKLSLPQSP